MKIQEKHLLPLLVLLSERKCDVSSTEEVAGVDDSVWLLGLAVYSYDYAVTHSNIIICGRRSKSIQIVLVAGVLIWWLENALLELSSWSRTWSFTAKTLKLLGFCLCLLWSFAGGGISCLFFSRCCHVRCSGMVHLLFMRFLFIWNADFQTAARFPELVSVLIIWNFTVCISH